MKQLRCPWWLIKSGEWLWSPVSMVNMDCLSICSSCWSSEVKIGCTCCVCVCVCVCACVCVCLCVCVCAHIHICCGVCVCECEHTHMCMHVCVCVCVCMHSGLVSKQLLCDVSVCGASWAGQTACAPGWSVDGGSVVRPVCCSLPTAGQQPHHVLSKQWVSAVCNTLSSLKRESTFRAANIGFTKHENSCNSE